MDAAFCDSIAELRIVEMGDFVQSAPRRRHCVNVLTYPLVFGDGEAPCLGLEFLSSLFDDGALVRCFDAAEPDSFLETL